MAVNPNIQKKANDIRTKTYGKEVRESLASGLEEMSKDVEETKGRQDQVEAQFQSVLDETTDKDFNSAPEIKAARVSPDGTNHANLKERLDKEHQEVTAQLAQTFSEINTLEAKKADKEYVDSEFEHEAQKRKSDVESLEIKKADKTHVWSMANMGQDVKEAMTGGSVAVVGKNAVLEENIVDRQITPRKTDFFVLSKNLFDKNKVVEGNVNEVTGEIYAIENYVTYEYKEAKAEVSYTLTRGYKVVYLDENDSVISGDNLFGAQSVTITTPPNTKIIRFSIHKANSPIDTFMFVEGDTLPSNYEAYGADYIPESKLEKPTNLSRNNFGNTFLLGNDLPTGMDLNDVTVEGNFTGSANGNYKNLPSQIRTDAAFLIENKALFKGGSRWYIQTITEFADLTKRWARRLDKNGSGTTEWVSLSSSGFTSSLSGKTLVCMGDSVTEFGDYPSYIAKKTGAVVHKCGFGGTRLAYHTNTYYDAFSMTKLADAIVSGDFFEQQNAVDNSSNFSSAFKNAFDLLKTIDFNTVDFLTLFYGTNDYMGTAAGTVTLGQSGETTRDTFYGAINYVIDKLLTAYPHLKLVFITPTWRENSASLGGGEVDTTPNSEGVYLVEYVDAIIERAQANHVPVLDLFRTSGINKYTKDIYLVDSVHPNTYGYEYLGNKIGSFMLSTF